MVDFCKQRNVINTCAHMTRRGHGWGHGRTEGRAALDAGEETNVPAFKDRLMLTMLMLVVVQVQLQLLLVLLAAADADADAGWSHAAADDTGNDDDDRWW